MTKEEVIKGLKVLRREFSGYKPNEEMFDMAIEALEQQSVLDKIRAEIEQKQDDFMAHKDYDEGIRFGLMLAYQVIGKYERETVGE